MGKLIRPTYPKEFSIGLLVLIFVIAYFLSHQIFDVPIHDLNENQYVYFGMFLVSSAVIIMILIIWEEFLFPIKVKEFHEGMVFRNHRTKLYTQLFIYLSIPVIFVFIYLEFEVNHVRFFIWAGICTVLPIVEKIASGINNYNDFLKLTNETIQYHNNEKNGTFKTKDVRSIAIITDDRKVIKKMSLLFYNNDIVTIDLDEMELDEFLDAIYKFITTNYKHLLKEIEPVTMVK